MADPDHHAEPGLSRRLRAWLRNLGKAPRPPEDAQPQAEGSELVDQAEAFQSMRVGDVMTPRADIIGVEIGASFDEVVKLFVEAEHSRMPIYRETLDDPVGVVHVKDIFKLLAAPAKASRAGKAKDGAVLHRLRREVLYVPPSMRAADLLARMRAARIHLALVIDEFGGCDGLVTMEDLVEAVVGDIDDEHDVAQASGVRRRPDGLIEADARASLEDLEALVGKSLTPPDYEEEIETVAGLVTALAGRVPQRGEVISHPDGWEVEVVEADPRRVKRVRLRPPPAAIQAEDLGQD